MYQVKVYITLKKSVLDPQGVAVKDAAKSIGYKEVTDVRIGKYLELQIEKTNRDIHEVLNEICDKLLANPVMEDYHYEIKEVQQ